AEDVRGDASYRGVSQNATSATTPVLTLDPSGRAFVAWDDISGGNPSVRVRGNTYAASTVYYVNDGVTPDHSFTSAASQAGFDGKSPSTPLPSIQAVLATYTLSPGDIILVDGGMYSGAVSVPAASNGFLVLGSPNYPTILQGGVALNGSTGVIFEN